MKKFFILCLMAFVMCVNANAQIGWIADYVPADELTDEGGYHISMYDCEKGYFAIRSDLDRVFISTHEGIFDYDNNKIFVLIGYYKNGVLIEKETAYFFVGSKGDIAVLTGKTKILNQLKTVGDIRIVAERYNRSDFDITIPMNATIK